jgi:AcrR family transcriptional regulator
MHESGVVASLRQHPDPKMESRLALQHECTGIVLAMTTVRSTLQSSTAPNAAHASQEHRLEPKRLGRRRDDTRDDDILDAALDVLAEAGYSGMTVDMVAIRAKAGKATVYRRWRSKAELVLDAVGRMKRRQVDFAHLPDTGTLRGDLLALFKPQSSAEGERKIRIMAGLASLLAQQQSLADAANAVMVEPWAQAHYALMQRALDRGEISRTSDIATASQVLPSMAAYRALVQRKAFDREFLLSLVDGVVLPALGIDAPPTTHGKRRK